MNSHIPKYKIDFCLMQNWILYRFSKKRALTIKHEVSSIMLADNSLIKWKVTLYVPTKSATYRRRAKSMFTKDVMIQPNVNKLNRNQWSRNTSNIDEGLMGMRKQWVFNVSSKCGWESIEMFTIAAVAYCQMTPSPTRQVRASFS
jgi:hypothetical protein